MRRTKYLRHTPPTIVALRAFQSMLTLSLFVFVVAQTIGSVMVGKAKVPVRGADIIVTTETPGWFALVLFVWVLMCGLFAFLAFFCGKQFVEALRA